MTQGFGVGKFQPQATARPAFTPPGAPAPVAPRGQSRWAGIQSAQPRDPLMGVGDYVVRVLSNELGVNPQSREESFKGHVEILWAGENSLSQVGDRCVVLNKLTGKSATFGMQRTKAYIVAAAGYDDDASYDQFDPQGHFIDAVLGGSNEYSAAGMTIVGRLARVRVTRGNDVTDKDGKPTGDYYREYSWSVIPEESQDVTKRPGA